MVQLPLRFSKQRSRLPGHLPYKPKSPLVLSLSHRTHYPPQKHGGCDGKHCINRADLGTYNEERAGFTSLCSCLARNTECDDRCACSAATGCLNRSVTARDTVKLGSDVQEVDSWGMDCYVRRNILDGGWVGGWAGPTALASWASIGK